MLLDVSPLRRNRDYRYVFAGQFVSAIGNFVTYVALPVQIYDLTKSSAIVGMLGAVQLVPLAATALWGGAVADAFDRRRLLLWCEALLMLCSLALVANALLPHPYIPVLFVVAALMAAISGFHSPGYLYSAMSVGAFVTTILSGWTKHVYRRGAAVVIAAFCWGLAIIALGYATTLWAAVACLALAGAADMVSGLFRLTIWNETIPSTLRGRMAAIEQLSYMTGPLLGNARAGFMAERFGLTRSIVWGGIVCAIGVAVCVPALPAFWKYRKETPASGQ